MQKIINVLPLERFFSQVLNQWNEFPLEMRLAEGSIMGGVALATIIFLTFGIVRKSAMGMIAGFFLFMTFMVEALAFGRLDFLPTNAYDLILATFFAATILFVTGSIRIAKDSITIGLLLLVTILGVFALGIADFFKILEAQALLQIAIGGMALFTVLFALINAFLKDRGAALVLPGFILAASSLIALYLGIHNGIDNWVQAVLPNALLALGTVFSACASLFSGRQALHPTGFHMPVADKATAFEVQHDFTVDEAASEESAPEPIFSESAMVEVVDLEELEIPPFDRQETVSEVEPVLYAETPRSPLFEDPAPTQEPPDTQENQDDAQLLQQDVGEAVPILDAEPQTQHAPTDQNEEPLPPPFISNDTDWSDTHHDELRGTPPNSSVWKAVSVPDTTLPSSDVDTYTDTQTDIKLDDLPLPAQTPHTYTVTPASANVSMWCWTAPDVVDISTNAAPLFGAQHREELLPVIVRDYVAECDLEAFDEHILGAGLSQNGFFDFLLRLRTGSTLRLRGSRSIDANGIVSRIVALVERADAPCLAAAPVSTNKAPLPHGDDNTHSLAAPIQDDVRLRHALENGEIVAHFQPIIRLSDHEVIGFETLVRWNQPETGQTLPASAFIHRIINTGLELQLIEHILDEAARELADWCTAEPEQGQFVTFNVSATEFLTPELVTLVAEKMRQYNLPTGSIVVEITESHVEQNQEGMIAIAKQLQSAGAQLALDDFGSGYANFSRLSTIPFDIVKTDKSLTRRIAQDENARHVLELVVDLSKKLGMKIIIEGVENAEMAQHVEAMHADLGQGYFYGLPEPAVYEEEIDTVADTNPAERIPSASMPRPPAPPPLSELR